MTPLSKAGRKDLDQEWKSLRRGWYVGSEEFRNCLEDRLEPAVKGRRRESHSGEAKAAHDEAAAEKNLQRGLRALGLSQEQLKEIPRAAPEKLVLAWWLRQHTTMSLRWASERLAMGHYTRLTQAVSRLRRRLGRKLEEMKRKLVRLEHE